MTKKFTIFQALMIFQLISCCFLITFTEAENLLLDFKGATFTAVLEQEPLKNVIERIRKEKGIWFKVSESLLEEKVSVEFKNLTVHEGLKRIFRMMNYIFLFDQDNNLTGVIVFRQPSRISNAYYSPNLNEQMANAAIKGDSDTVMELLAEGADVNAAGKYSGWTPLMLAARKGDTELVNFLIAHGADIDAKSSVRSRTALMEAARNRKVETVKALLAGNPDVDAVDWEGYTALMFVAVSGQLNIVSALIANGADVNAKNKVGSSALMMASGYPKVVEMLIEAGASE